MGVSTEVWAQLGPQAASVAALTERINQVRWFYRDEPAANAQKVTDRVANVCRHLGLAHGVRLEPVSLADLPGWIRHHDIGQNSVWTALRELPDDIRVTLDRTNRTGWLSYAVDTVPASVFHRAFDAAFARYGHLGQEVVLYAVSSAMWISGAAIALSIANGAVDETERGLVLDLLTVFEDGVLPLGLYDSVFYVA